MNLRNTLLCLVVVFIGACGGGGDSDPPAGPQVPPRPTTGTGRLTILVMSSERRPWSDAQVRLFGAGGGRVVTTGSDGVASFSDLPARVGLSVQHSVGNFEQSTVHVAQDGDTTLEVFLDQRLAEPTVALLPSWVASVSADRRELTLHVRLVSSRKAPFKRLGTRASPASPYLGLMVGDGDWATERDCNVFVSDEQPDPVCAAWGDRPYVVTVDEFTYDEDGTAHLPPIVGTPTLSLLMLDQGSRLSAFDQAGSRSRPVQHLMDRYFFAGDPGRQMAIAGFAGTGGASPPQLPTTPLWAPRGTGTLFTNDTAVLESDLGLLLPLTGGSSPVVQGLQDAMWIMADANHSAARRLIAVVGGDDDTLSGPEHTTALGNLVKEVNLHTILVGAYDHATWPERSRVAEIARAMSAVTVGSGTIYYDRFDMTTDETVLYSALDLAMDILDGTLLPTLTATFRIRAPMAGAFPAGSVLRGDLFVEGSSCSFDCDEVALAFAVPLP